ncbi:MAG TPA: hypothetical protein VJH23_03160 [archaeon]|nr:hypothetical protein [archaeon]
MGMVVKTEIFPLRASLKKKDSWELIVDLQNEDPKDKMISIQIDLPGVANFSTVGLSRNYLKQVESFRASSRAQFKLPVYISSYARTGNHMGKIKVMEHFNDFDHVERSYAKEIPFRIVD